MSKVNKCCRQGRSGEEYGHHDKRPLQKQTQHNKQHTQQDVMNIKFGVSFVFFHCCCL